MKRAAIVAFVLLKNPGSKGWETPFLLDFNMAAY